MKQEIKFTYTLEHTDDDTNVSVPCKIEITLDGQVGLEELTEQFNAFVRAMGYYPSDNCVLDWVDIETGQPPTDNNEVANTTVKRKF
jgi:hypothetical protein